MSVSHQLSRETTDREAVPIGDVLDALSNEQRRAALRVLTADCGTFGVRELAREASRGCDSVASKEQFATALHHNHLPRLDELGLVTYDSAENVVEPDDSIAELRSYLEFLDVKEEQ
ncbi:DUF7344 domain-containing protein [Halorientalis salina]|uniref:DUF7344 domain-containing protein n=1 Tax=Halorientalis salina TaxID=2932266 RepID=UPI0010AC9AB6|nr:hypothetical protein [Halorientalis salina]